VHKRKRLVDETKVHLVGSYTQDNTGLLFAHV